ncbi:uncharacterized protein LOC142229823 [Haematobia irritans]|uniref:uncharacterized protein LOC142229823 n=1 Tax=Haematobia irritans TaxID=7368 RepID=UPI003F507665
MLKLKLLLTLWVCAVYLGLHLAKANENSLLEDTDDKIGLISAPWKGDDDFVAVASAFLDIDLIEQSIGNIHPTFGPISEIDLPFSAPFNIREKRHSYGHGYHVDDTCRPISVGKANRVTKG